MAAPFAPGIGFLGVAVAGEHFKALGFSLPMHALAFELLLELGGELAQLAQSGQLVGGCAQIELCQAHIRFIDESEAVVPGPARLITQMKAADQRAVTAELVQSAEHSGVQGGGQAMALLWRQDKNHIEQRPALLLRQNQCGTHRPVRLAAIGRTEHDARGRQPGMKGPVKKMRKALARRTGKIGAGEIAVFESVPKGGHETGQQILFITGHCRAERD